MINPLIIERIVFEQQQDRLRDIEQYRLYRQVQAGKTKRTPHLNALLRAIIRRWRAQARPPATVPAVGGR